MDLDELKTGQFLFDPSEFGRIFVFVDFANVRSWAKSFWKEDNKEKFCKEVDIKKVAEVSGLINPEKTFFYYGFYKECPNLDYGHERNIKHRKSIYRISKARKAFNYTRSKEIKEIKDYDDDGKYQGKLMKCNFDVEIALDMLVKIKKYDTIMLWSGDSDFDDLIKYLQSKGKKVIVICARNYLSRELKDVADKFIPAEQLKGSLEYEKQ